MHQLNKFMTSNVYTVNETQSVQDAANLMSQYNIGSVPVVNNAGQMVGIITDRDITLRTTAQGEAAQTPISQEMTAQQVVQGTPEMDAHEAAQLMAQHQIRRLPVVENGQVIGMVALGDLAVDNQLNNEAEEALSSISTPSEPQK
ncbi:CBS domain-containing protein [Virgibacillus alimentarius]|uniref:CBS domain-containing protein n=2 Tax=Virgibacillus alimentarius TaxID=698769 RepID=A0ABS4S685_9BACI|nr:MULTISPECIES: CBS domain-containing protein [Virgibacillus]MBP2256990.1 CBS domain-containing protein [Virgibacillus alimentarius]HLR68024.1 CBS domain-containing protein [Virgibacillus sp.]